MIGRRAERIPYYARVKRNFPGAVPISTSVRYKSPFALY